ncbi:MAG TPA: hypothetical protein PLO86_03380, partial [Syntrophales bacterium]|nr:hypothetical protein [Syntrophales bacterium]
KQHLFERQWKKLHRQGARFPTTEAYSRYAAGRREVGQHSIWAFYEAARNDEFARGQSNTCSSGNGKSSIGKAPDSRRLRRTPGTPQGGGMKGNTAYGLFTKPPMKARRAVQYP